MAYGYRKAVIWLQHIGYYDVAKIIKSCFVNGGSRPPVKTIEELTSFDRLFLKILKIPKSPKHYKLIEERSKASVHDDYYGYFEIANIELPLFMLQLNKFGSEFLFPSFFRMTCNVTLDGVHEFVGLGVYEDDDATTYLSGTDFVNAHLETTNNTFSCKFSVEQLQLDSTDYRRVTTNLTTGDSKRYEGLNLLIDSSSFSISGNMSAADDGTLSVSNVIVHMSPGEITMDIPKVSQCFASGGSEDLPSISQNAKQLIVDMWSSQIGSGETLQKQYSQLIEDTINDFLSGRTSL